MTMMKTCEIPVTREYPKNEKTPTKIKGIKGNYNLFRILIRRQDWIVQLSPIEGCERDIQTSTLETTLWNDSKKVREGNLRPRCQFGNLS